MIDFSAARVVVPLVSHANVPQLAVDLLVSNLGCQRVARLDSTYLYPFVSPVDTNENSASKSSDITTALEVYYSAAHKLAIVQQRSPVLPSYTQKFLEEVVVPFVCQFEEILVLNSEDLSPGQSLNVYHSLNFVERMKNLHLDDSEPLHDILSSSNTYVKDLYKLLHRDTKDFRKLALIETHVAEGDNFYDAVSFYLEILKMLKIAPGDKIEKPFSWTGLYGDKPVPSSIEEGIYG